MYSLLTPTITPKSTPHPRDKANLQASAKTSAKTSNAAAFALKKTVAGFLRHADKRLFPHLAETFQALGDTSRIQIVWALAHGELCVSDLTDLLGMTQPAISHHLRTLRNLKLVRVRRSGRTSYYSLDDSHINHLLREGIEHVEDLLK